MASLPSGHDQPLDFQGFLHDLQDWELSLNQSKDKKFKSPKFSVKNAQDRMPTGNYASLSDPLGSITKNLMTEEGPVDAVSEKELGNEYFKQKKFKEAIECYSRSIAFQPTAVAYANRAMAYLKLKRFEEAENDCTEALDLDDRYLKAYSRRATARKELGKLKASLEDSEFALRLEPNNQEVKKQYAEVKSLYEKVIFDKASRAISKSSSRAEKGERVQTKVEEHVPHHMSNGTQTEVSPIQKVKLKAKDAKALQEKSVPVEVIENHTRHGNKSGIEDVNDHGNVSASSTVRSLQRNGLKGKEELKSSVEELASRAASRAMAEAAQNIIPPTSAYEFEVSWRGFAGNRALQAHLLKVISPTTLPQLFKYALSATMLVDIVKCVATFFSDDMDLAVKFLENLIKVPRFSMLIMCLPSTDKAELTKTWDEVFCSEATPIEYTEILDGLRSKYCLK